MTRYRVSFFKDIINCYGKPFNVCQATILVDSASSRSRAVELAKARFAQLERIGHWNLHADRVEVERLADAAAAGQTVADDRRCSSPL